MLAGWFSCLTMLNWKSPYVAPALTHREGSRKCLKPHLLPTYRLEVPPMHIHPDLQGKLCAQWAFGHDEMLDGCCYFKLSDFLTKQNTPSSVNNTVSKTMCTFPTPLIHPEALLTAIFESLRFQNYHSSYPSAPPLRCT